MLSILSLVTAQVSVEDSFQLMEVPDGCSKRVVATEPLVRDPVPSPSATGVSCWCVNPPAKNRVWKTTVLRRGG